MNAFVFWPEDSEAAVVSLAIRDGVLYWGARDDDGHALVCVPVKEEDAAGIRAVLTEQFGPEAE